MGSPVFSQCSPAKAAGFQVREGLQGGVRLQGSSSGRGLVGRWALYNALLPARRAALLPDAAEWRAWPSWDRVGCGFGLLGGFWLWGV